MTEYTAEYMAGWERAFEDREELGRDWVEMTILNAISLRENTTNWTAYDQGYLNAVLYWQEVE